MRVIALEEHFAAPAIACLLYTSRLTTGREQLTKRNETHVGARRILQRRTTSSPANRTPITI